MGRGHRLTTTIYLMPCAASLAKESIITGIIIPDDTRKIEIGESINISDRAAMEWIGKVADGADQSVMRLANPIKVM